MRVLCRTRCACGMSTCMDKEQETVQELQWRITGQSSDGDFDHLMASRSRRGRRHHCDHRVRLHQCTEGGSEELRSAQREGTSTWVRQRRGASTSVWQRRGRSTGSGTAEDCPTHHYRRSHCLRRPSRPGPITTFQVAKLSTFRPASMTTSRLDPGARNKAYMNVTDPMTEVPHA